MFALLFVCTILRARVPTDSGGMHPVLIFWSGRVYMMRHNTKYQLYMGDVHNNAAFVDYVHGVWP